MKSLLRIFPCMLILFSLFFSPVIYTQNDFTMEEILPSIGGSVGSPVHKNGYVLFAYGKRLLTIDPVAAAEPVVSTIELYGDISKLYLHGDYVIALQNWIGFEIVDVSDPVNPQVKGRIGLNGILLFNISCDGDYVYLSGEETSFDEVLRVYDISDPENPAELAAHSDIDAEWVHVADDYAYVWSGNDIMIYDVSDPSAPEQKSTKFLPSNCKGMFLRDNDLLVLSYNGFNVLDVSDKVNPGDPVETEFADYRARSMFVGGDMAAVCGYETIDNKFAMRFFDVSDFSGINESGKITYDEGEILHCCLFDTHCYVAMKENPWVLHYVDVSDPASPADMGMIYGPSHMGFRSVMHIAGDNIYVYSDEGIWQINVSDRENPRPPELIQDSRYRIFDVMEGYIIGYDEIETNELRVVDISDIDAPNVVSTIGYPGQFLKIEIEKNYAFVFVKDEELQMHIVDLIDPANPAVMGSVSVDDEDMTRSATDLILSEDGNTVWLLASSVTAESFLLTINVSDKNSPTILNEFQCAAQAAAMAKKDNMLIVCSNTNEDPREHHFEILDISTPGNPQLISDSSGDPPVNAIALKENILIASEPGEGIAFYEYDDAGIILKHGDPSTLSEYSKIHMFPNPRVATEFAVYDDGGWSYVYYTSGNYRYIFHLDAPLEWFYFGGVEALKFQPGPSTIEDSEKNDPGLKAFPLPAADKVSLSFRMDNPGRADIQVIDSEGRPLEKFENILFGAGGNEFVLDCGDYPSGTYFIRLRADGATTTGRFIIER